MLLIVCGAVKFKYTIREVILTILDLTIQDGRKNADLL